MTVKVEPPVDDILVGDHVLVTDEHLNAQGIVYQVTLVTQDAYLHMLNVTPAFGLFGSASRRGKLKVNREQVRKVDLVEVGVERSRLDNLMRAVAHQGATRGHKKADE